LPLTISRSKKLYFKPSARYTYVRSDREEGKLRKFVFGPFQILLPGRRNLSIDSLGSPSAWRRKSRANAPPWFTGGRYPKHFRMEKQSPELLVTFTVSKRGGWSIDGTH
jgi:hypothetical protein